MSSEEAAEAAAEELNLSVRLADLEQKYVDLELDRNAWFAKANASDERVVCLQEEKETFQSVILKLKEELSISNAELQKEKSSKHELEASATNTQERASRIEAEADDLREEIRYVTFIRLCAIRIIHAAMPHQLVLSRLTESNKKLQNQVSSLEVKHKLDDSSSIPLQYEVERLKKEVDALAAHSKWLEEENSRASEELAKVKVQNYQNLMEKSERIEQVVAERDECRSKMHRVMASKQEIESQLDKLSQEFRDSRLEAIAASEASDKELQAERKLVDLQKEQLDRAASRLERLEKELKSLRDIASKASADVDKEVDSIRDEIQREANKALEMQEGAFRREIEALKVELNKRAPVGSPLKSRRLLMMGDNEEPMGLTDLYARLNETEDELIKTRAECEKHKSYVQRVEAEIAAKTPQMLRQRKEYEMALERQEEMHSRLRDALQETKRFRDEAIELREELSRVQRRNDELQGESKDLAKHVQALLASKAGADVLEGVPTDIVQVQQQNQQLMVEQRRLSTKIEELQHKLRNDRTSIRLEQAEQELENLHEQRNRQEKLVASIVQQRDLYRALLSNQDGVPIDFTNTELVVTQHSQEAKAAAERCKALEQDLARAHADLTVVKGDKEALLERVDRYNVHTNELTATIDKLQNELSAANANVARSDAESSYYRDKCSRAEQNLDECREEVKHLNSSKREIQALNERTLQQLATANAEVAKRENDVRQVEMKLRMAKTQEETAKAAESRLAGEVSQLRAEVARHGSLSETIQRIEASLTAKSEEDKEKLKDEAGRLKQLLENERVKFGLEQENLKNRVQELELATTEAERKKDEAMKESIVAKGEALAATTERQKLIAKIARLESEVSSLNKKLGTTVADPEEVTLQAKVESLAQQLEEAKSEVVMMKTRAANFEKMAKASEHELTLLTQASDDFRKGKNIEIEEFQRKIDAIKEEGKKKDEVITELTMDLSSLRGEQEKAEAILKESIVGMKSQLATAEKSAEVATLKAEELAAEIQKYRDHATKAQSNYERELDLHAAANKDLRDAREEIASEKHLRRAAEEQLEIARVEIVEREKQLNYEKEKMTISMNEMEVSLKLTRTQNELLLSQLTALGEQVEKAQNERIEMSSGDMVSSDEVETLRRQVSDLREVVKFMRSEREMNDAKIDAARRTAEREKAASAVTKRSLDEARAELKILQEQTTAAGPSINAEMEERLKKAEEQLIILQESNRLLRDEGKKLHENLASTKAELDAQKLAFVPLEQQERDFSVQKAVLVAERSSLQRELESWKQRVQSLVSKFNQIDPEDYSRVLKQVESLQNENNEIKIQKEVAEKEGTNSKSMVSKLNKDLAQQKALVQKQQSLLKKMQTDKETSTASSSTTAGIVKENALLKDKIQKMDNESKSNQTELKGANDRIEMLKQRMRQFQKTIGEQRKKISDLETAAAATPAPAPAPSVEVKATHPQVIASPTPAPPKAAPIAKATEPAIQSEAKEVKQKEPIDETVTVHKEQPPPTAKEVAKASADASLPSAPDGGFRFGPSATEALPTKDDTHKRAAISEAIPGVAKAQTSAPPSKKAKVVDEKEPNDTPKSDVLVPEKEEVPAAQAQVKDDEKAKSAQALKDQLKLKREALAKRKKKLEEATAKQNAQTPPSKDEQPQETKSVASLKSAAPAMTPTEGTAVPPVPTSETSTNSVSESKESVKTIVEARPGVKEVAKAVAEAAKAAVQAKAVGITGEATASEEKSEEAVPKPLSFASSPFGSSTFGSGTVTFGATSFGKPTAGGGMTFGTSASIGGFGGMTKKDSIVTTSTNSSVFLDMKPPSSTAAPFSFGSSSITLPTPSIAMTPAVPSPFAAFGGSSPFGGGATPFGGVGVTNPAALPLFGSSTSIKRSAPDAAESDVKESKLARVDEEKEAPNAPGESGS